MFDIVPLTRTNKLLIDIWDEAEQELKKTIATFFPGAEEEVITLFYYYELAKLFLHPTIQDRIRQYISADLRDAFPSGDVESVTREIRTSIHFHPRNTEKFTSGDFGILVTTPQFTNGTYSPVTASAVDRGLLVQAKKEGARGWGKLSKSQSKKYPQVSDFLAIQLVRFSNKEQTRLEAFRWTSCRGVTKEQLDQALKQRGSPAAADSTKELLGKMMHGGLGTTDPEKIKKYITAENRQCIRLQIGWEKGPPGPHKLQSLLPPSTEAQHIQIRL